MYSFFILFFVLRMVITDGYFAVAYLLGFYIVQNVILFLTPLGLPSIEEEDEDEEVFDIPENITLEKNDDESKPVIRKLGEFVLWKKLSFFTLLSVFATFFKALDLPVFWPLLLMYFLFATLSIGIR